MKFYPFLAISGTMTRMCGRYGFSVKDAREVYDRFGVMNKLADFQPRYNIAPGEFNPVILRQSPNRIERMLWGLIPQWAKDETMRYKTINARCETVDTAASYRKPFRFGRVLIPATGFFEWDKSTKPSTPSFFFLKHEPIFAFAGLYDTWTDPKTGKKLQSYTIITCPANGVVGRVHNRMPVILRREDEDTWLNPDITEPEHLKPLLVPYMDQEMDCYQVGYGVNNPRNDSEDVIKPKLQTS
jgi:putative SOS response-associated peptidase YedK